MYKTNDMFNNTTSKETIKTKNYETDINKNFLIKNSKKI